MFVEVEPMSNIAAWTPAAPGGASVRLLLTAVPARPREGTCVRVAASEGASGHTFRASSTARDLSAVEELRLWVRSPRKADGTSNHPFFLRMRLASAAVPFDNAANVWHRLVPVTAPNVWQMVRFSLNDLPAGIRGGANGIEFEWRGAAGECDLQTLLAVREQMVLDVESALTSALGQLTEGGTPVPAVVVHQGATLPALPHFRITAWGVQPRPAAYHSPAPCDFTDHGFRMRPPAEPYELFYDVDAAAASREVRARLLEFALGILAPRAELSVNRLALPVELLPAAGEEETMRGPLRFRISSWQSRPAAEQSFRRVATIDVEADSAQGRL